MKRDMDLKFWEIKIKGTKVRLYCPKFVELQNKKICWQIFNALYFAKNKSKFGHITHLVHDLKISF